MGRTTFRSRGRQETRIFRTTCCSRTRSRRSGPGARRSARERYGDALVVEESKRFGLSLDARETDGGNRSRTPHRQIRGYLTTAEIESDGRIRWGILTNGGVWRLYDHLARPRESGYFEVDLGASLEPGNEDALRAFYLLFRRESFVLRDGAVTTFLESALAEGKRYEAQEAQDLSSVVFERVFPSLVKELAEKSGEELAEVRQAALIFLYRMLFVLYAEDRGLLPVNDSRYDDYGLRKAGARCRCGQDGERGHVLGQGGPGTTTI